MVVIVVVGLAQGAQMTEYRDLTMVGEMGSDRGQYWPWGP